MSEAEATAIVDETASKFIEFFRAMRGQKEAVVKLGEIARKNQIPMSAIMTQMFRRVVELSERENFEPEYMVLIKNAVSNTLGLAK